MNINSAYFMIESRLCCFYVDNTKDSWISFPISVKFLSDIMKWIFRIKVLRCGDNIAIGDQGSGVVLSINISIAINLCVPQRNKPTVCLGM